GAGGAGEAGEAGEQGSRGELFFIFYFLFFIFKLSMNRDRLTPSRARLNPEDVEMRLRSLAPQQAKNRQALLNKVRKFWVEGVLSRWAKINA
ncbi:MAG: hypothetical protein SW833_28025, partial [Cyanobacteriota bacterium]|nr:hypothetical protein [Cyanobacteriota bacterium]